MVGDYIFDATLNGVFDSADAATDMILSDILLRRRSNCILRETSASQALSRGSAVADRDRFFDEPFITDMLKIVWGLDPSAKVLIVGPASLITASMLQVVSFDGDMTALPFPDGHFDLVIETGLCYLPRRQIGVAAGELRRVAQRGVVLGSVTCDVAIDLLERHELLAGVKTLTSRWDWSDEFLSEGIDLALSDPARLAQAWERAQAAGAGPGSWYDEAASVLYSFYECASADGGAAASGLPETRAVDHLSEELVSVLKRQAKGPDRNQSTVGVA